jgi:hypothetical protein
MKIKMRKESNIHEAIAIDRHFTTHACIHARAPKTRTHTHTHTPYEQVHKNRSTFDCSYPERLANMLNMLLRLTRSLHLQRLTQILRNATLLVLAYTLLRCMCIR